MDIGAHPSSRTAAAEAMKLAADLYGFEAKAVPLPSEYDDNFRLDGAEGTVRVLKVMHPRREPAFVDMQCQALAVLAAKEPDLPVPRVVPDRAGRAWSSVSGPDGQARIVWMLSYLAGRPIAGLKPVTPALLEEIGGSLARLDLALAGFAHPAARRELNCY